jgi:serine/threonine protein kinase
MCRDWPVALLHCRMLAGRRAFEGVSDTLANVLKNELDWGQLPRATPIEIRTLLRRCLQKDPRRRWQSAAHMRIEIEEAVNAPTDGSRNNRQTADRQLAMGIGLCPGGHTRRCPRAR